MMSLLEQSGKIYVKFAGTFDALHFAGFSFLPQNLLSPKAKQNKYCVVRHTKYQVYCSIFSRVTLSNTEVQNFAPI